MSNVRSCRKNNASVAHVELGAYMDREDLSSVTWVRLPMLSTHKRIKPLNLALHDRKHMAMALTSNLSRLIQREGCLEHRSWTDNPNASSEGPFLWYHEYGSNQPFASLCSTYSHAKARQDLMLSLPYLRKAKRRRIEQQCWRRRSVIRKLLVCALFFFGKFLRLFHLVPGLYTLTCAQANFTTKTSVLNLNQGCCLGCSQENRRIILTGSTPELRKAVMKGIA